MAFSVFNPTDPEAWTAVGILLALLSSIAFSTAFLVYLKEKRP